MAGNGAGALRRLQVGLGALFGDPAARRARELLDRLDRARDWLTHYRAAPGQYATQLDALMQHTPANEAAAVASLRDRAAATELPGLPRPDVGAFAAARDRLWALIPEEYRAGETSAVCFDVVAAEEAARRALEAAPQAEAA